MCVTSTGLTCTAAWLVLSAQAATGHVSFAGHPFKVSELEYRMLKNFWGIANLTMWVHLP